MHFQSPNGDSVVYRDKKYDERKSRSSVSRSTKRFTEADKERFFKAHFADLKKKLEGKPIPGIIKIREMTAKEGNKYGCNQEMAKRLQSALLKDRKKALSSA